MKNRMRSHDGTTRGKAETKRRKGKRRAGLGR